VLREDFSGSSAMACAWTGRHRERRLAVDLDPASPGREHHVALLSDQEAARVSLLRGDVRDVETGLVDVVAAFNFSYFVFQQRGELLATSKTRKPGAAGLALDLYGGADRIGRSARRATSATGSTCGTRPPSTRSTTAR
jgi:hypothetical protein